MRGASQICFRRTGVFSHPGLSNLAGINSHNCFVATSKSPNDQPKTACACVKDSEEKKDKDMQNIVLQSDNHIVCGIYSVGKLSQVPYPV